MARPRKWRQIDQLPSINTFAPAPNCRGYEFNILEHEELEALRLKDLENLDQETCAQHMQVSRPTFRRILISARNKIADSLVNGKAVRIEGGNYTRKIINLECNGCGKIWQQSIEQTQNPDEVSCPSCNSADVFIGHGRGPMNGHGHGRGRRN